MLRQASARTDRSESDRRPDGRPRQGFRRDARGRRRHPRGPGRHDLRPARAQRRRQDHDASDPARDHRPVERQAGCVLGRDRPLEAAPEVGYLPEERGPLSGDGAREAIAFMGALRGLPLAEGRRRADELLAEHDLGEWAKKPIRTLVEGHGADRPTARHDRPRAAADRPRRAVLGPRRDQPGPARGTDPARGPRRRHHHLLDPRHRPRRAAVRADRDHRRGQGGVRGPRRRGARTAAADRPAADPRGRRAVALGDSRRTPAARATNGCSSCPRAAPSRCSRH